MRHQIITNCMRMCDNGKYWKLKCFKSKENRTIGQWSWYDKSCCFIRTAKIEVACFIIVLCAFFSLSLSVSLFLVSFHSLCVKHFQCSAYSRDVWFFFSVHVLFTDNGTIDIVGVLFAIFVGIFFLYSQCICAHTPSFFFRCCFFYSRSVFSLNLEKSGRTTKNTEISTPKHTVKCTWFQWIFTHITSKGTSGS